MKIAILGAGMAGFGAAHRLYNEGVVSVIYEKNQYHGGHTASYKFDSGFIFDVGPHVSFTKDKRIQKLLAESVKFEYQTVDAHANNYWRGHRITHPVQCNLYGLPPEIVVKILSDFIHEQNKKQNKVSNYADWLIASYGKAFAETFPMEYTLKYHTTKAENMSTDWIGPRMYKPKIEELLYGAISPITPNIHYVTQFRYPQYNGFVSYLDLFLNSAEINLNYKLLNLDPITRKLRFANGVIVNYDAIISSIPLPELVPMISGVPDYVVEASEKLACSSCVLVNIGINREDISEANWSYFYDRDIFFTRLCFPHMMSPNNTPPGTGSIQSEVYYSKKYRPLDRSAQECIQPVIKDLFRCGLLHEDDKVIFSSAMFCEYANIIFDLDRADALTIVHEYLDDIGVNYCGRYGEWGYLWTDESFISGENAAQKVLDKMSS